MRTTHKRIPAGRNASRAKPVRRDPERTQADIISAATKEFAAHGVRGARVDAVAGRTRTTRAMIYYYFKSKEGLYLAVLEAAYRGIREAEQRLDLAHLQPVDAMRRLVAFTFDYFQAHPHFVALVVAENQSGGKFIRKVSALRRVNASIIDSLSAVLQVGAIDGVFRSGIDPIDVHMLIVALGLFPISNRHTFGHLFDRDMSARRHVANAKTVVTDAVLAYVMSSRPSGANATVRETITAKA